MIRKLFLAALAASLLLAACGGSDGPDPADDPEGSLEAALDSISEYEGVTVGLSVASDTASLTALSEGALTEDNAQRILDSSISFSSLNAENPEDAEAEMSVNIAGSEDAVEMKVLGTDLYLRADVQGLMEMFGADPAQLGALEQQVAGQPGFEFVEPAIAGEWIVIKGLDQLQEQFGGGEATEPTEAQREAITKFAEALKDNSSVETGDKEGPGDHLIASVQLRPLVEDLQSIASDLGAGESVPTGDVPDEEIDVDAWVEDGRLSQIELDLTQFKDFPDAEFPEGVDQLAIRLTLDEFTGGVEAPADAVEVDINTLLQGFMGSMGGSSGTGGGGTGGAGDICAQLEQQLQGQSQDVIDQFEQIYGQDCPEVFQ